MRHLSFFSSSALSPLVLLFLIMSSTNTAAESNPTPEKPYLATIEIPADAAYEDTPESIASTQRVIKSVPVIKVPFPQGSTLSGLIADQYRFGMSNTDTSDASLSAHFLIFKKRIKELNGIEDENRITKTSLLIPLMPKWANKKRNTQKTENKVPNRYEVYLGDFLKTVQASFQVTQNIKATITDLNWNSASAVIRFTITDKNLVTPYQQDPNAHIVQAPIEAELAENCTKVPRGPISWLNRAQQNSISSILRKKPKREVYLIILDTGWPLLFYNSSLDLIEHVLGKVRSDRLRLNTTAKVPRLSSVPQAKSDHTEKIARSLTEVIQLDPKGRVKVIFLPLTRDQGADRILELLLETYDLIKAAGNAIGERDLTLTQEQIDYAGKWARAIAQTIPEAQTGNLVITDEALIDAIVSIFHQYDEIDPKNEAVFMLNLSWTTYSVNYEIRFPKAFRGLLIAAAGNGCDDVSSLSGRQFGLRALNSKDTVAVMNMGTNGELICDSSFLRDGDAIDSAAVGFSGVIDGECGTSFAAPRVGWLLALHEVYKKERTKTTRYANSRHNIVRHARSIQKKTTGEDLLLLDVDRLLKGLDEKPLRRKK